MNEIYKDITGYEGLYKISNLGNIKSLKRKKVIENKVLKPILCNCGYLVVNLHKGGKRKRRTIHQLVAEAFLNHTPNGNKLVVDHQNNISTDNRLENLQIITNRENNSKDRKRGTSKHVGVTWHKKTNKWQASISINGKRKHLGVFTDELKASEAYQNALSNIINN